MTLAKEVEYRINSIIEGNALDEFAEGIGENEVEVLNRLKHVRDNIYRTREQLEGQEELVDDSDSSVELVVALLKADETVRKHIAYAIAVDDI